MDRTRRTFLKSLLAIGFLKPLNSCRSGNSDSVVITVKGPVAASSIGKTLIHEHILVDFIGADLVGYHRWDREAVIKRALPYLRKLKESGYSTFFDCTPAYLGRDPLLLKSISEQSDLHIVTNTGYYGARNNLFLPAHAINETADQIAKRWITEWTDGIDGTGIRPGFIKIGVDPGRLSSLHEKLVRAAAKTHKETGLTIASHTGPAEGAFHQLEVLQREGVGPESFVWVHAQSEEDPGQHVVAARMGAWVSLDGIRDGSFSDYLALLKNMKDHGVLNKVLISHDAGWYSPGEEDGGRYVGYQTINDKLVPLLFDNNFTDDEIQLLLIENPGSAFGMRV